MTRDDVIAYCLAKRGAYTDTPFGPDTLVIKVLNKMFAALSADPTVETVNLKCEPDHALILRNAYPDHVQPGYHMNKKHWNTVTFTQVPDDELRDWISESYDLVVASMTKADRTRLQTDD